MKMLVQCYLNNAQQEKDQNKSELQDKDQEENQDYINNSDLKVEDYQ